MTPLTTNPSKRARPIKVAATVLAGVLVILLMNSLRAEDQDTAALSTQSVLTLPERQPATAATLVPTTAPIPWPTSTPTAVPTPTAAPTATATPVPTATAAPTATPPPVEVADARGVASAQAAEPAPTATAIAPPATAIPEATPTPIAPEPTPTLVAPTVVEDATAEPTSEPTPEPTPTPTPPPLQTTADLEVFVLGEINKVRAQAGLGPLAIDPAAVEIARDWSQQMATGGFFDHRPADQLNQMLPSGWRQWGENIASAPDIFWAQSSLEASPGHYKNMVGSFTHVGVGVYTTGGQVWLTQVFVRY